MEQSIMRQRAGMPQGEPAGTAWGPSRGPRVWAGAVLLLGGVALVILAGCFLMGAVVLVRPDFVDPRLQPDPDSAQVSLLLAVLYVAAAVCMVGAAGLVLLGVRGLVSIAQERGRENDPAGTEG